MSNFSTPSITPIRHLLECVVAIALLIVVLVSLPAALYFFITKPSENISLQIDENAKNLSRARSVIANASNDDASTNQQFLNQLDKDFVTGTNPSLAFADLQSTLGKLIALNGAKLVQARQVEFDSQENGELKNQATLGLNVRFRGSIVSIYKIIHAIESNKPLLFINSAKMNIFGDPANKLLSSGNIPAQLVAELELLAYFKPKSAGSK